MNICCATKQWRPHESSPFANIGSLWIKDWKERRFWRSGIIPILSVSILIFGLFVIFEFKNDWLDQAWLQPTAYILGGLIVALYLPLLLSNVLISGGRIVDRLFVMEFWVSIALGAALVLDWPWKLPSLFPLVWTAICFFSLRLIEALLWQRQLDKTSFEDHSYWVDQLRSWNRRHSNLFGMTGFAFIASVAGIDAWLTGVPPSNPNLLLAMAIFCIPLRPWLITRLAERSAQEGWIVRDFAFFKNLRSQKLGIFHSTGVLTKAEMKVEDEWVDEGMAGDIRDIVLQLTAGRLHPIAQSLEEHFPKPKRFLFELEEIDRVEHLGIRASFRDPQRSKVQVVFGTISWHRILQSEMVDEGRAKVKSWVESGRHISLLSINQSVVAAFCFSDRWRPDAEEAVTALRKLGLASTALSSSCLSIPSALTLNEVRWDLFPVERKQQLKVWLQRMPSAFEIASFWDAASPMTMPRICLRPHDTRALSDESVTLVSERLAAIPALVRASRSFHRTHSAFATGLGIAGLASASIPSAPLTAGVVFLGFFATLLWTSKFALK